MANIYVRSTDGSNSDNGSTWALAKLDLAGAAAIDAAGDTIYVSQSHAESTAAGITLAFAGTLTSPVRVLCGNDAAEPPTALATTGTVTTTGASAITISGSAYFYGLTFSAGSGNNAVNLTILNSSGNDAVVFEDCSLRLGGTSTTTANIGMGGSSVTALKLVRWGNCTIKFASAAHRINVRYADFRWDGGGVESGTSTPTTNGLITLNSAGGGRAIVSGVDLSNFGSTLPLVKGETAGLVQFRNCKLPASWTGNLFVAAPAGPGVRAELHNCDSGDTNYRLWVEDYAGSIKHETTIVRTGGASDGTTTHSWKMATSANSSYPLVPLESPEIVIWNDTTGTSKTATIEIVHDSQGAGTGSAARDDEIWIEVQYLGTSGYPLGSFVNDCKADVLATAADQTSSSETWTTTGLTTPVKQKLSVTFTPQEKGYIIAKVKLAKASKTYYVDPKITVS